MRRRIPALTATTLVLVLLACTTNNPSPPSQPPRPTHTCTPTSIANPAATAPYACSSEAHRKQQERDALEAEAIALYKRFSAEYMRLIWAGGSDTLTPDLEATLAEPMKSEVLSRLADQKHAGETVRGPQPRLSLRVDLMQQQEGSVVTLKTCDDLRGASLYSKDGDKVTDGQVVFGFRYFKHFDGTLKLFIATVNLGDTCPF